MLDPGFECQSYDTVFSSFKFYATGYKTILNIVPLDGGSFDLNLDFSVPIIQSLIIQRQTGNIIAQRDPHFNETQFDRYVTIGPRV